MSHGNLEAGQRGPTSIWKYGNVLTADGPVEADGTPLLVSEALSVLVKVQREYSMTFADTLTVVDADEYIHGFKDTLAISQSAAPNIIHGPSHHLTIRDHISFVYQIHTILTIADKIQRYYLHNESQPLVVVQEISRIYPEADSELLDVDEVWDVSVEKSVHETLNVVDGFSLSKVVHHSVSDALGVQDSVIRLPNVGSNQSTCAEGYVPAHALGTATGVLLTFPFVSPSTSIALRNPKFGNTDSINTNTRFARTRSGQLSVARPAAWPTIELLKMSFEALSQSQADAFLAFIKTSAALEIGYLDQEARQWRGYIIDPTLTSTPVGIGCQYTLDFQFRGRLA